MPSIAAAPADARWTTQSDMIHIAAVYRVSCAPADIEALSQDIAYEQTVEVPPALINSAMILEQIVGRVEAIEPVAGQRDCFQVTVGYNLHLSGFQIPQLLNLIYGNISLKRNIRLVDLDLPGELLQRFRGPNFGVEGIRRVLGVYGRPLLATALKPMGSSAAELAELAHEFSLGGGDLVKDDHNLHDESFAAFCERIVRCRDAVAAANRQTGRNTLYVPNILAPVDQLERYLDFVVAQEIRGILIAPFLVGLDFVRAIAEKYPLIVLAHPTVSGAFFHDPRHGIAPGILLGKLFRLLGTDVSIFPNSGGRFSFSDEDCRSINHHLRAPLGQMKAAFPAPAGGMRFDNIPQMAAQYGPDSVCLIGGALLSHSGSLADSTRAFLQRIEEHFESRLVEPERGLASACELPATQPQRAAAPAVLEHLAFQDEFAWEGRPASSYKAQGELAFRAVERHELIGRNGEKTAFDLRYFQIEPGGYSSLEKHLHTHTIICVRGTGSLKRGEAEQALKLFDVAYVPPLQVHQLRNESSEPFGFFCIVDHERDRPLPP
jgi:ribulose-bisphosphate carboxylase large chain